VIADDEVLLKELLAAKTWAAPSRVNGGHRLSRHSPLNARAEANGFGFPRADKIPVQ
jgi:hypothetical protein